MFKFHSCALCLLVGFAHNPVSAAPQPEPGSTASTATASATASIQAPSIAAHLQLREEQLDRLDRVYANFDKRRAGREATIEADRDALEEAQQAASFDKRRASRLLRTIDQEQHKIADDFLEARDRAIKVLSPVQRSQLEALQGDNRMRVRFDRYFELFLLPVEEQSLAPQTQRAAQTPQNTANRDTRQRRRRGVASYNVYGGYSYGGPNYGVVGSYNQGPVGAHVGVGRGGPFFGVGIGGILSRHLR